MDEIYRDDPWLEQVRIGVEAEQFLNSKIGRNIQARANREIQDATVRLIAANPHDYEVNQEIRREIQRAQDAINWMIDAINGANQARVEIEQQEAID